MKKFLSSVACFALVCVLALSLCGCGSSSSAMAVRLHSGSVAFGEETAFANSSDLKIEETDTNTFNISGTASFMTADQAEAFWSGTAAEGDAYVVVEFDYDVGTTISYTSDTGSSKSYTSTDEQDELFVLIIRVSGEQSKGTQSRDFTVTTDDASTTYTLTFNDLTTTKA